MRPECEQFIGRKCSICNGEADLPLDKINGYRKKWNLIPLEAGDVNRKQSKASRTRTAAPARKRNVPGHSSAGCSTCGGGTKSVKRSLRFGPGEMLMKHYADIGLPHCEACRQLADKMNEWGPKTCEEKLNFIVEDIYPRAKHWVAENKPFIHKLLPDSLEDAGIRRRIRSDVTDAIKASRTEMDKIAKRSMASDTKRVISKKGRSFDPGPTKHWIHAFTSVGKMPEFVTLEQFALDIHKLISQLPPNITSVAGVSRSGLYPATMIAMMLHVPLYVVRHHQGDVFSGGNGWRLKEGAQPEDGTMLVVDDTTMTGNSLRRTQHILKDRPGHKLYAAVYVNPKAIKKPDLWAVDLPWPHLLQWNLFNSVLSDATALDFDGILCHDCPVNMDDDGPQYQKFLAETRPLHIFRKRSIPLIVTARLEKYRPETEKWLANWGMSANRLVMGPWANNRERAKSDVAAFKAEHFKKFMVTGRTSVGPRMFVESDARQAARIAELSGGLVVCPAAARCFHTDPSKLKGRQ